MAAETAAISEGEVAIYDRQLRLWGVQAQQRLMKSKVLIWGLEGSNVEMCKNLVLAGIAVTVRDHRPVDEAACAFNYFLREAVDMGKNRAECAAGRIQEMNPLCTVASNTANPTNDELDADLKNFDFVCLSLGVLAWDVSRAVAVDAGCRKSKAGFVMSASAGELAFFFSDLQEHVVQERSSGAATAGGGGGSGGAGAAPEDAKPYEPEHISFASFQEMLECAPAELAKMKVDAAVVFFSLVLNYLRKNGAKVGTAVDFEEYCKASGSVPILDGIEGPQFFYEAFFVEPLMHVASVLGGLMAQEVIKALTQRDPPLVNCVCFDAFRSAAIVERIPAEKKAAQGEKRKAEQIESFDLDD